MRGGDPSVPGPRPRGQGWPGAPGAPQGWPGLLTAPNKQIWLVAIALYILLVRVPTDGPNLAVLVSPNIGIST